MGTELMRRFFRQEPRLKAPQSLRTAGALRARAEELAEQRRKVILAREAKERIRREREQAAARDRHLSLSAKRQADAWRRVETLIASSAQRLPALRDAHAKKPSLARLRMAGL